MQVAVYSPDVAIHELAKKTGLPVDDVAARVAPVIDAIEQAGVEGGFDFPTAAPFEGLMPVTEAQAEALADAMYRWAYFAGLSQPDDDESAAQAEEDRRQYPELYVTNDEGQFVASGDRTARFLSAVTDIPFHVCLTFDYADAASNFDSPEEVMDLYADALHKTLAHNLDGAPIFSA